MTARPGSIADLSRLGAEELARYRDRDRPPGSPLEWLGIAVGRLPELAARGRTADDVHWYSRTQAVQLRISFIEALLEELGVAAAILEEARVQLVERHPGASADGDPEGYAELVEAAQLSAPRRAEPMIGAYASFVGGAIETAGALADAELAVASARRWERGDPERVVSVRATQLNDALTNALGGLLAYARLVCEDIGRLRGGH